MKGSIKFLSGFAGALGLVLSLGLPSLAQANNPMPNSLQNRPVAPVDMPTSQFPGISVYQSDQPTTIADIISRSQSFEMLNALLPVAGLSATDLPMMLKSDGSYTVFAPTDEAFAALPEGTIKALVQPENRDLLVELLRYHVIPGNMMASSIRSGNVASAADFPIMVQANGGSVMVNDATVIRPDIVASNGVIHVIDRVIVPPALQARLTALVPAGTPRFSQSLMMNSPVYYQNRTSGQSSTQNNSMPNSQMNRNVPIQGENTIPSSQPQNIIPGTRIENRN